MQKPETYFNESYCEPQIISQLIRTLQCVCISMVIHVFRMSFDCMTIRNPIRKTVNLRNKIVLLMKVSAIVQRNETFVLHYTLI